MTSQLFYARVSKFDDYISQESWRKAVLKTGNAYVMENWNTATFG